MVLFSCYASMSYFEVPGINILSQNDDIINRFVYSYPINIKDACGKRNIFVMMPVNSAVTNFDRRNTFRNSTQGTFVKENGTFIRMLFFVGIPSRKLMNNSAYQKQLQREFEKYGDIIQMNVADTYRNLSLKAVGTLNWISEYCSNSQFVLKTDDDVRIDIPTLLFPLFQKRLQYENFIIGHMKVNETPYRISKLKRHYMPVKEFPKPIYPPFVYGPVEGFPTTTAILLHQQALRTKMIFLDDIFVTGICRTGLRIPIFHNNLYLTTAVHHKFEALDFIYSQ